MTRQDFYKHLLNHNCETFPLSEFGRATAVGIRNKSNGNQAFLDTPLDNSPIKSATVCQICSRLGVEIPSESMHAREIIDYIKNKDFSKD